MAARDPAEALALWRYHLIAEALDPKLTGRERGLLVRADRRRAHHAPAVRSGRSAATPSTAGSAGTGRRASRACATGRGATRAAPGWTPPCSTRRSGCASKPPARSAAHISEIIRPATACGSPSARSPSSSGGAASRGASCCATGGRSGGTRPTPPTSAGSATCSWVPSCPIPRAPGSVRARLFVLVDDHSRLLVAGRWVGNETLRAGQELLHAAILRRGAPDSLYVDNGSAYSGAELARSCAILGIRLIHSRPYAPEGRGKQERLNRVIRERFLLEATRSGSARLDELNDRFAAWVSGTSTCGSIPRPASRPSRGTAKGKRRDREPRAAADRVPLVGPPAGEPDRGRVSFEGNEYEVDPAPRRADGRAALPARGPVRDRGLVRGPPGGLGRPRGGSPATSTARHRRHRPAPHRATGIDYLGQVLADHEAEHAGPIAYRAVPGAPAEGEPF